MSLNKVQLIGRLGKDPEIRTLTNGGTVANLSLATSEKWKDKRDGETKEKTQWHTIVVWNEKTIEFIEKYLSKGDLVYIQGKLETRSWEDQSGNKRYSTEVVLPQFAQIEDLQKLNFSNDNDGGNSRGRGGRDDDRGNDRDDRGSRSSSRDDRGNDRGRDRDDDRGNSRGSSRSSRDDDRGNTRDDDRGGRGGNGGNSRGGNNKNDMDDDIPF
jgi:single-strand DNA-binding protein